MDVQKPESLFFMDLPDLRALCSVKIYLNTGMLNSCIRDAQIKLCRHLLCVYDQIVAAPNPEQFDQITVIMTISFYRTGKVQSVAEKYASTMESPQGVTTAQLQACLSYTITLRLSPQWNKAGHLLIQGADFLSKSEKQDAVDLRINVSDGQICICVQVQKVRLQPSEVSDFNVSTSTLQSFLNDPSSVIQRHFIPNNWCYVLPSMKMGQIVSIGHNISSESPFKTYKDFQIHWNMLYGYELPSMSEDKVIYCNVYFKLIGENLFTYPFICLRSQPFQFYQRVDVTRIVNTFISDLRFKMSHLCGFPVRINENPVYTVMELTRPLSQNIINMVNLTAKLPQGSLYKNSRYNAATSQKMVTVKQAEEYVLQSVHPAKPTSASSQMGPFTSPARPFQNSCPSVKHERTVTRHVPVFPRKNVKVSSSHFQISALDKRMFNCITRPLKEDNSTSVTVSSVMVLSKSIQPSFSQIKNATTKLSVRTLANRSVNMKNNVADISRTMNPTQHPNSIAVGKHQLYSSCQMQVKPRPLLNPNGAELLHSHTSDGCERNYIDQITSGIPHKNQNAEAVTPTSTECITGEVSVKEQLFDFNPKRCRNKQSIKDVDVLKHAKNNQLHKLNNANLQNWLKQHEIPFKARDKKVQLVAKIMQFFQEL
ncbi:uncharacterized protein C18orf63 homolog [Mantella aurantiaca]